MSGTRAPFGRMWVAPSAGGHHYVGNMHKSTHHRTGGARVQPPPSARDVLVLTQIVDLVRSGAATTRPELEAVTGLGRTVVNDRVREGVDLGVLAEVEAAPSGQRRGRPSRSIRFRTEAGVLLAASLGEVSLHAAVTALDGRDLVREFRRIDVQDGPEKVLRAVHESFRRLLRKLDG